MFHPESSTLDIYYIIICIFLIYKKSKLVMQARSPQFDNLKINLDWIY